MPTYSDLTPVETLTNNREDVNVFRSPFANLRWNVVPEALITVDAKYEANLPGLAFDYYGDTEMWRVILAFNGLVDPVNDVQVGVQLGIPSRQSVDAYLASQSATLENNIVV